MRYQPDRKRAWRAWLVTTAERQAIRLHRAEAAHVSMVERTDEAEWIREPADPRSDRAERAEAVDALRVLAAVPERRRRVMELHVAGFTYDEIAAKLGSRPADVTAARSFDLARRAAARLNEIRAHGLER